MIQRDVKDGLPQSEHKTLRKLFQDSINMFCTSISSGYPAGFIPLKNDLQQDAKPILVLLPNYAQEQKDFLLTTMRNLDSCVMAYSNPTSPYTPAHLLVPKRGPSKTFLQLIQDQ